jgi:trimeric autotransporter adhesin
MKAKLLRQIFALLLPIFSFALDATAQAPNTISTMAGGGANAASAMAAYLPSATAAVRDALGNTYVAVPPLNIVYKINSLGQLSVYAGTGVAGFSGDGGPAASAKLNFPVSLALDGQGDLFISDSSNNRIRRVDATTGDIATYAGSGNQYNGVGFFGGYSGDGGPATSALMNYPSGLAFDGNGNLFVADAANEVVRRIDNSAQHVITTYAGNGKAGVPGAANGDGGPATSAQLNAYINEIMGLATDANGDLFIADSGDSVVRMVDTSVSHIITTYAGSSGHIFSFSGNGGPANQAGLNTPMGVVVDRAGNLLIGDTFNGIVRMVDTTPSHIITTAVGGNGSCLSFATGCGDGGPPASAALNRPWGVFVDSAGNLLVADFGEGTIRTVSPAPSSVISTFAGGGNTSLGGAATSALLALPYTVVSDASGNLFVLDNAGVDRFDSSSKTLGAYAGNSSIYGVTFGPGNGDNGPANQADFFLPFTLALDSSGDLFVDDFSLWVRRVDGLTKTITTYAGTGAKCNPTATPGCGDGGSATGATFVNISGMATDSGGNLYVADSGQNRVRRIDKTTGLITNYAGTGTAGYSGDNGPATSATLSFPVGLAFDSQDNLYVADAGNNVIRKIDNTAQHNITTYAFNGLPTFGGDGGTSLSASMQFPDQVALDANGNLFVGGGNDNVVRRIDATDQSVITVAGDVNDLDGGFSGDGGPSTQAMLDNFGVAIDGNKNLYIGDAGNNRVRSVHLAPVASAASFLPTSFGPLLPGTSSSPGTVAITNSGLDDLAITSVNVPTDFVFSSNCSKPAPPALSISPGGSCFLLVSLSPAANASAGTITGNLTFSTSDPANPSFSFPLSGIVAALPGVTLTVSETGGGSGIVFDNAFLIDCPTVSCSANFALNQQVVLSAFATTGSFTGWTVNGSTTTCPGTGTCTVTMSQAQNVVATFGTSPPPPPGPLTVLAMGNGSGTITSSPAGINCTVTNGAASGTCTFSSFPPGTANVTLSGTATGNSTFAGWLGSCRDGVTCTEPVSSTVTAVFSGPAQSFVAGQILVGAKNGLIFVYNPDGTVAQVLNSGHLQGQIYGMKFDKAGNLYAANPSSADFPNGTVEFFGSNGAGPTTFGTGYASAPGDVHIDPAGDVFVSQSDGRVPTLFEFAGGANGAPSSTFFPASEKPAACVGCHFIDLLDDNESMLYTSGESSIGNFDILFNYQNPDFATNLPGTGAFQIRELSDKSVLVADRSEIVRLSPTGTVIQTYTPAPVETAQFYALRLDSTGSASFWTADGSTGKLYQIQISDGTVLNTISTGLQINSTGIYGIATAGQFQQAGSADISVSMTAAPSSSALTGSPITYTITVTNNGPGSAANVAMTDAFPSSGITVVSATSSLGTCSGTQAVTCVLGTMASGQGATITIVVTPTETGTLLNTANVTSTTPDASAANNTASTSTTVIPAFTLTILGAGGGSGTITDNSGQINCVDTAGALTGTCSAAYASGTVVTLNPSASAGSTFSGWSTCAGLGTCNVTMTSDQFVEAVFTSTPQTFTLTISDLGAGTGIVTDNLGEITCADTAGVVTGTCSASYSSGTVVTLTDTPTMGSSFSGWGGACAGTGSCAVTMTSNQNVAASFAPTVVMFTVSVSELGTGTGSITDNLSSINCSEANGITTGTCSASYPSGTPVVLTETATAPSAFGGWGGACSTSGTSKTCGLAVTSALNVTANFLPPPVSMPLTFSPGTNVVQQAAFDCPSNPDPTPGNPCTDPNANAFQLQIAQVNSTVNLTVTATEVPPSQGDGLCQVGNTVANDFECRFTQFFNYGLDGNGNTIVPLCYPYANGNCVHYQVYSGTPGTEPDPTTYSGPIDWKITWNNDKFTPPAPYTNSTPQLYDDPGEPLAPGTASGDVCGQPMTVNGMAQTYSCQFEFDITTFFTPTEPVDAGIGGRTKQLTDVVVAYPPTTSGQLVGSDTPDSASVRAGAPVGITLTLTNSGPASVNGVSVSDALPDVSSSPWTITGTTGSGTCSITGPIGAQVLACSIGTMAAQDTSSVHLLSGPAFPGNFVNTAEAVASSNGVTSQQVVAVANVTVQADVPSFSALSSSQSITAGTASINLSGTLSAPGTPTVFPQSGETVSVSINGAAQLATVGTNGAFSVTFPTATIPASGAPYTITYTYAGDTDLTAATDTSTNLTVNAVVGNFTVTITEIGTGTGEVSDNTGQITCSEVTGVVSGSCSGTYSAAGAPVVLTESATSPSTFGGWGDACSTSGTSANCTLSQNTSVGVTANFLPPPVSVPLTFSPGTNVMQQAPFDCPSNPNPTPGNPCTDPNAHNLQLQIGQVSSTVNLTVTATEVPPSQEDGLCEVGNTVLNDFDCRFTRFFNYGLDGNGNTIVPLCYPYANGNCVHYQVYSGTPGTEPDPTTYSGPIDWKITWNNDKFTPPAPYTNSTPQLYDDPGEPLSPGTASGDVCGQPMTVNGVAQTYSCQFEFDITTVFDASAPVDAGIGGRTKQLTDFVVAFPPTGTGSGQLTSSSTAIATTPGSAISFSIAVNNSGPGKESAVTLSDPLPDVSSTLWTISPAYSGPGTCSISGAAGAQVLVCTFGDLAAGANFSIGVSNPTAAAGTFTNTATISAANQQVLSVSSVSIAAFPSAFSGLATSQTIVYGTPSIGLSGVVSAPGPLYPPAGEMISVTINGVSQNASIGVNGAFSLMFPTATVPASPAPYAITFGFKADSEFAAASNATTTLTVTPANQTITFAGGPASAAYGSTFPVSATASSGLTVTITASGSCTISGGPGSGTVTVTSGAGTCLLAANQPGNSNYDAAPQVTSSTAAQKASSTTVISSNTPNPSTTGQAVAIGVKVTGSGTPTGSVQVTASTGENCTAALASGAGSCSITFTIIGAPTLTAVYTGDNNFNGSTSAGVSQAVNAPTATALRITPSSVNFGNVDVGSHSVQSVTLTNTGQTHISISSVAITSSGGEASREFFATNLCPHALGPNRSCTILVTFGPAHGQTAPQSATLVITDSAADSPQSVPLTGTPINPQAVVSPSALNLGHQKVGTTSLPMTVRIENTGTTPLSLKTISIHGDFAIASGTTCSNGGTVHPEKTCIINITFTPKSHGQAHGTLVITDNALSSPQLVTLSGIGN